MYRVTDLKGVIVLKSCSAIEAAHALLTAMNSEYEIRKEIGDLFEYRLYTCFGSCEDRRGLHYTRTVIHGTTEEEIYKQVLANPSWFPHMIAEKI